MFLVLVHELNTCYGKRRQEDPQGEDMEGVLWQIKTRPPGQEANSAEGHEGNEGRNEGSLNQGDSGQPYQEDP